METGLSIRPVQTTSVAPVRVEPSAGRQVVRTELPETQTVSAVDNSKVVQLDRSSPQQQIRAEINNAIDARLSPPSTKVELDDSSKELVFRKISQSTGEVVQQYPDEAMLRQRAYTVQQRRAELDQAMQPQAELSDDRVQKIA